MILRSLSILLALLAVSPLPAQVDGARTALADRYITLVNNGKHREAARLFHYPPTYSGDRLRQDIDGVASFISFLSEALGDVTARSRADSAEMEFGITIFGGEIDYWAKQPAYGQIVYRVDFAVDGPGYIEIFFVRGGDGPEIREVKYSFPADRPDGRQRLTGLTRQLYDRVRDAMVERDALPGQIRLSMILVRDMGQARLAEARLAAGEEFAAVARDLSLGPGRAKGGDLGYLYPEDMAEAVQLAAMKLKTGDISDPIVTEAGVVILKKTGEQ